MVRLWMHSLQVKRNVITAFVSSNSYFRPRNYNRKTRIMIRIHVVKWTWMKNTNFAGSYCLNCTGLH